MREQTERTNPPRPLALVPAYRPDPSLPDLAREVLASGAFASVWCVDDGSGPEFASVFAALEDLGVRVLRHHVNLGKGMALRTGINAAAAATGETSGIVTFDADGQHKVADILAVADALRARPDSLVLGVRSLPEDAPFRSRFGNAATRRVLHFFSGLRLTDTQTGLRGVPTTLFPALLRLKSTGYDFELDMLITASQFPTALIEVPIEAVYIDDNASSHFSPITDSIKVYFVFLRFASVSITTALLDYAAFAAAFYFTSDILSSLITGRVLGAGFQFSASRSLVFQTRVPRFRSALRYLAVLATLSALSFFGMRAGREVLGVSPLFSKWLIEGVLFFASFLLQREFVYHQPSRVE